jgi:DnaJ-class molecular chaperone
MKDLYKILGVQKSASEAEVKKSYRKLAKELHPDQNKDNPTAAARFSEVTAAYDLLSDASKRAQYDRGEINADGQPQGYSGGGGGGGFDFSEFARHGRAGQGGQRGGFNASDIFEDLFARGGRPMGGADPFAQARPKGADVDYMLAVPFEAAAKGESQRLTLRTGKVIDIKLPKGLVDGQQMRLAGQGYPGAGGAGDARVTFKITAHKHFRLDGFDVRLELPVSLTEVVKGAKVKVPTVDGAVMLTVAPGSTSGQTLRLRGKGFIKADGTRGDQYVLLLVDVPKGDAALEKFIDSWKAGMSANPRKTAGLE